MSGDSNDADLHGCNGYDGPDGFAYHAVGTFAYVQPCFRGESAEQASHGEGSPDGGAPPGGM